MICQVVVYLAMAPKSDAVYRGYGLVREDVQKTMAEPVPLHLRNAPTRLMKSWGYSEGYDHAHVHEDAITDMVCLPEALKHKRYYFPTDRGVEKRIAERLKEIRQKKGWDAE